MQAFHTAARKIERMITDIASGGAINQSFYDQVGVVWKAINKLDDRTNKVEIRADETLRDEAWAKVKELRAKMREAEEAGFHASQAARRGEVQSIKDRERDRIANMNPSERALYNYQQELKIMRGK